MAASRDPFGAAKMKNRAKLISTLRVSGFADGNVRRGGGQRSRAVTRLVTAVLFATQASSFTQVQSAAQDYSQIAQFCVPSELDSDAHRLYCRDSPNRAASSSTLAFCSQGIWAALNRNKYNAIT
jgi:hypothetical protein